MRLLVLLWVWELKLPSAVLMNAAIVGLRLITWPPMVSVANGVKADTHEVRQ